MRSAVKKASTICIALALMMIIFSIFAGQIFAGPNGETGRTVRSPSFIFRTSPDEGSLGQRLEARMKSFNPGGASIKAEAFTSSGELYRTVDISDPYSGGVIKENTKVIGQAFIEESLSMGGIPPGEESRTGWFRHLFDR